MKATVLTIGDEILIGQIVDTNSVSIAKHLNAAGIVVAEKISVGDDGPRIAEAVRQAMAHSEVTILTGGLGPTKDDITKKTLAELFGCGLACDARVADHVRRMLEARGIAFNGVTAPGLPFEMEHLMQDEVMPRLKARFALKQIVHRTLITTGLAESMLAARIEAWENALPPHLKLAYLPNPGAVRLRLSAYEVDGESAAREIEGRFEELRALIPEHVVGYETATVQELIHAMLTESGRTLAVAESCTGGTIAARFTAMPGASAYFLCGVVSYSNESKIKVLGVDPGTLERHGAVSEATAREMAEGARRMSGADFAVATTGIAGPTGGTDEKPVGTVWMAVATPRGTVAVCRQCGTDRGQIIDRASSQAIALLREEIVEIKN